MEIIKDNNTDEVRRRSVVSAANIYLGSVLILAGVFWMLYNVGDGIISRGLFHDIFSWEVLLVAVGGYLLASRRWAVGTIVTILGVLFVLGQHLHFHIPIGEIILPCVLIALGVAFLIPKKK